MKIDIDQDKCVGAGQCVLVAPEVFGQRDEDGVAVLLTEDPPARCDRLGAGDGLARFDRTRPVRRGALRRGRPGRTRRVRVR
ncbi:hypothetical protein GCM10009647_024660 [Streptomyces sanglieri]|uniref:Ferredoxin n=1 Tax=Streptomyces sanglieri TaxID=193460 RepID=A0ABW2X8I5_9ACTN|nr:ferredoxin [Streptomyces sp. Wh19]MDV9194180.1 ferredoxin [Streptomyces sp. Wh19]